MTNHLGKFQAGLREWTPGEWDPEEFPPGDAEYDDALGGPTEDRYGGYAPGRPRDVHLDARRPDGGGGALADLPGPRNGGPMAMAARPPAPHLAEPAGRPAVTAVRGVPIAMDRQPVRNPSNPWSPQGRDMALYPGGGHAQPRSWHAQPVEPVPPWHGGKGYKR
jgi:hypothetical protein